MLAKAATSTYVERVHEHERCGIIEAGVKWVYGKCVSTIASKKEESSQPARETYLNHL